MARRRGAEQVRKSGTSALTHDLLTIGVLSPVVVAARAQMFAAEGFLVSREGRREMLRMTAEKQFAAVEMALAVQRSLLESSLVFCAAFFGGAVAEMPNAATLAVAAAIVPLRRRVRGNVRRLSRGAAS